MNEEEKLKLVESYIERLNGKGFVRKSLDGVDYMCGFPPEKYSLQEKGVFKILSGLKL